MLTEKRTDQLFPTRLVSYRIAAPEVNEAISTLVLEKSKRLPSVSRGERLGWQSANDFFTWSPDTRRLGGLLAEAVMGAHPEHPVAEISLFGWANVFTRGVYFNPHSHADAAWSGVYYVDAAESGPTTGGMLMVRDPRSGAGMVASESNRFDSGASLEIAPRTGEVLIFPSWLIHWVTPYEGTRPRISVSFNAR